MPDEHDVVVSHQQELRRVVAIGAGAAGLVAYNWWLLVVFVPGMVRTTNGFFSDFAAQGLPHASALQALDLLGGSLVLLALLLTRRNRAEWPWLVVWAAAAAIGGRFPYACAADVNRACARLELQRQLPFHHYIHMAAGIVEFGAATMAIWRARGRLSEIDLDRASSGEPTADLAATTAQWAWRVLLVGYPLLALAFLSGRGGVLVEPVFFACFSLMAATYLRCALAAEGHPGDGVLRRLHLRNPGATIASR